MKKSEVRNEPLTLITGRLRTISVRPRGYWRKADKRKQPRENVLLRKTLYRGCSHRHPCQNATIYSLERLPNGLKKGLKYVRQSIRLPGMTPCWTKKSSGWGNRWKRPPRQQDWLVLNVGRCNATFMNKRYRFSIAQYLLKNSAILDSWNQDSYIQWNIAFSSISYSSNRWFCLVTESTKWRMSMWKFKARNGSRFYAFST